ncbi:insulin receptor substrate 2-B [Vanacampus margaritifer]
MANLTNYQEGKLMLEMQQRNVGSKSADANAECSVREPPSPLINITGGGGGGFHSHLLPPSYHHHLEAYHYDLASHFHHLSADVAESPGRKSSSPVEHGATSGGGGLSNPPDAVDDIRKCGYMRKQKHGHKRFFVLRASSHLGPSRLEYYDNEKKFRSSLRGGTGPVGPSSPKRVIYLYQCFTVNKRADSKNKYLIALCTKDDNFAIVAENEQDQEDWHVAISELMNEGRRGHLITDDLDDGYGTVTHGTVFKEVWHVNVKPKGLGQTKNLTGLYRLCLSSKTLHLIKLNSETPCVNQHLMNIRRCGNSDSFFFIEVGRFSSIGPGEIWMQVDDSVVAQKMHETLLKTMKALKAYVEIRPRSKSQSSGSNSIPFVTTHRHLSNLPPSQTGLQRRSRMESVVGTPPSSKSSGASGYRFRTSSEGEGTMSRLFRSTTGSLVHLNTGRHHLGRADGDVAGYSGVATGNAGTSTGGGRHVRAIPGSSASTYHARSASLPVSHPFTTSPVSVSSSSGHGSVSDTLTRPSSASICGSPSDGGFNSSDEYGSSPGDFRYFRVRSNTPDSLGNTPPIKEENCLSDYMAVGFNREVFGTSAGSGNTSGANTPRDESTSTTEDERFFSSQRRRRSGGPGVAVYQKMTQTSFPLEEGAFGFGGTSAECSQQSRPSTLHPLLSSTKEDSGYVPMMWGVAPSPRDTSPDYMPMHPGFHPVSHSHQFQSPTSGPRSANPQSQSSTDAHGYMMMLPGYRAGSPTPVQASLSPHSGSSTAGARGSDGVMERPVNAEYMDMSCSSSRGQKLNGSSGSYGSEGPWRPLFSPYCSLPRSYKAPTRENDEKECDYYVPMASFAKPVNSSGAAASSVAPERRGASGGCTSTPSHPPPPYSAHHTTAAMADRRVVRPNRLPLGRRSFHGLPRVGEPATSSTVKSTSAPKAGGSTGRPPSPGEYINIDFGDHYPRQQEPPAYPLPTKNEASTRRRTPPLPQTSQDYMSMEARRDDQDGDGYLGKSQSPRPSLVAPWNPPSYIRPLPSNPGAPPSAGVHAGGHWRSTGDYTDMTYSTKGDRTETSPTDMLQHLCIMEGCYGLGASSSTPPMLPPRNPARAPAHPLEPKVVRADPQGRRRHSSETFSSTSSSNSTPSGGASSAAPPTPADPATSNAPEGQASKCADLASFDRVWMSVESCGELPVDQAQVGASDPVTATSTSVASTTTTTTTSRMYESNMSVGYQNGLNYIALEVRDDKSCVDATTSPGVSEPSAVPEDGK